MRRAWNPARVLANAGQLASVYVAFILRGSSISNRCQGGVVGKPFSPRLARRRIVGQRFERPRLLVSTRLSATGTRFRLWERMSEYL